jgi:hypothetical protein
MQSSVTPVFPRNNRVSLPIRDTTASRSLMFNAAGYGQTNPIHHHPSHPDHPSHPSHHHTSHPSHHHPSHPSHHHPSHPSHPSHHHPTSDPMSITCLTIARHVENCPVCGKLYDTDKTLHLLIIFGLCLICFFLVKNLLKS